MAKTKENKYSSIVSIEEAIGLLEEKDNLIAEQEQIIGDLNSSNGTLETRVKVLEEKSAKAGGLPTFEHKKKNYNFTARNFRMTHDGTGELELYSADKLVADLNSEDKDAANAASEIIAQIIAKKIGVIEEAK